MSAENIPEIPSVMPTLAMLVIYRPDCPHEGPFLPAELSALVTGLRADAVIDLCVFVPRYMEYGVPPTMDRPAVPYSSMPKPNTWGYL